MSNNSDNRIPMQTILKVTHVYGAEPAGILLQMATNEGELIDIFLSKALVAEPGTSCRPRSTNRCRADRRPYSSGSRGAWRHCAAAAASRRSSSRSMWRRASWINSPRSELTENVRRSVSMSSPSISSWSAISSPRPRLGIGAFRPG